MIQLKNVVKTYANAGNKTAAVNGISLNIKQGEKVFIKGASASGKSTLLHIIGCIDLLDEGEYYLDGQAVHKMKLNGLDTMRSKYISYVFQNFALLNSNSVYENIELPLIAMGISRKERKRRIEEAMEQLEIADCAKKLPSQMSGGQQQRCAIARALVMQSKIILADEPTGALDYNTGIQVMELLTKIQDRTIIVVTHDSQLLTYADRVIEIKDGTIIGDTAS